MCHVPKKNFPKKNLNLLCKYAKENIPPPCLPNIYGDDAQVFMQSAIVFTDKARLILIRSEVRAKSSSAEETSSLLKTQLFGFFFK